jgi:KaiC/GvpD/RAD55 family RecA-like ATPase
MNINEILNKLQKVKATSSGKWMACCPAHPDQTPSLSVSLGDDERILLHCHAGCSIESVLDVLQLEMKDLFPTPFKAVKSHKKIHAKSTVEEGFSGTWDEYLKNPYPDLPGLIDWEELFNKPPFMQEWLAPFFIPKGKHIAVYGDAKIGKSLFTLEAVAAIAAGKNFLGLPTQQAKVLYLDFENHPLSDIKPRLEAMGFQWEELDNLYYLSFPELDFLDSPSGGEQLYAMVKNHGIELVIIDTIARITEGKENDNDTWNDLEKYTERLLKREGVTFLRIDHAGKTKEKGPRGGSSKQGDVDITWLMELTKDGNIRIKSDSHRFPLVHNSLTIRRETTPVLHHELVSASKLLTAEERIEVLADYLDSRHEPRQLTVDETANALRRYGERAARSVVSAVAKTRKQRDEDSKGLLNVVVPTTHSAAQQNWSWMSHSRIQHKQIGTRHNSVKTLCVQQIYDSALKA